jgi:hypothetical protein
MRVIASLYHGVLILVLVAIPLRAANPVIVHEWGTFTCLQDGEGKAIGGINVDDEPVPSFAYSVAIGVAPQFGAANSGDSNLGLPPYRAGKGWISGDPQVTMRLETPVLYFYPPKGQAAESVPPLDVHVDFHGGVLSQYYPHADFSGLPLLNFPSQPEMSGRFPYIDKNAGITEKTTTSLDWKRVQLGTVEKPIETDDKVWTTPREVSAPILQIKFSEKDFKGVVQHYTQAEHYLFYRGVGHLDSPLRVDSTLQIRAGTAGALDNEAALVSVCTQGSAGPLKTFSDSWLVDIRGDGTCAFSSLNLAEEAD